MRYHAPINAGFFYEKTANNNLRNVTYHPDRSSLAPNTLLLETHYTAQAQLHDFGYCTKEHYWPSVGTTFNSVGESTMLWCLLKPEIASANGNTVIIDIGKGAGTRVGKDNDDGVVGKLKMQFHSNLATQNLIPQDNSPSRSIDDLFNGGALNQYSTRWNHLLVANAATHNKSFSLSVEHDDKNRPDLELSLNVYVFAQNGQCFGPINSGHQNEVFYNYNGQQFGLLAFVKGTSVNVPDGKEITFAVGDPRTDAKLKVTETDV